MKIGILTFPRSQNYGALLQAYGVQHFVEKCGYDVSMIDYWPTYHEEMYKPFSWQKFRALGIRSKIKYVYTFFFTYIRLKARRNNTRRFYEKFLYLNKSRKYDIVIYGSDQIWRKQHQPTYKYFNPIYWGDEQINAPHKIAYAASMGKYEIDDERDKEFVKNGLAKFEAISIREIDLRDNLFKEYGVRYPLVCDPVFLLSKQDWEQMTNSKYLPKEKYILYYRLQNIKATDLMVEDLAQQTSLPIIEMRGYIPPFHYGKRYRLTADAQEFITLINGAEYVVTSAYHGIAMSIIYEKQFFFTSQKHQANRVQSLFEILELTDRIIDSENVKKVDLSKRIDYTAVRAKLIPWANESRNWLKEQIKKTDESNH